MLILQIAKKKCPLFKKIFILQLPLEIQSKVSQYMRLDTHSHSDSEGSTTGVSVPTSGSYRVLPASDSPPPMCPFPPSAMVYAMRGGLNGNNAVFVFINWTHVFVNINFIFIFIF